MKRAFVLVALILELLLFGKPLWVVSSSSLCKETSPGIDRPHSVSITDFGAVGDGLTMNTKAFENAIFYLNSFADKGGAQLFIPKGQWLTGSFMLISHLTLHIDKDAQILGSTNSNDWPVIDPLPSYGRGRELPGGRHRSLIYGRNLTDVIITGDNGTIDGQGSVWWNWFRTETLNYTRPHMVELIDSKDVIISNLTFRNSPFWNIHPVYCRLRLETPFTLDNSQVIVQNVTIIAPLDSPNTDGIDPDSSDDVCIEDCYISTGDDLIAIKSGWDEYGISYAHPSTNIIIHRLVGQTTSSSGITIGSEMSGGVSQIHVEDVHFFNSNRGVSIKTSRGRGGYINNVFITGVILSNLNVALKFNGNYGEHPDESYDPDALPLIEKISIQNVTGKNIKVAGHLEGIEGDTFKHICLSDITLDVHSKSPWICSNVEGFSDMVSPDICKPLEPKINPDSKCYQMSNHLRSISPRNRGTCLQ